jgi:hypothetical protein
LEIADPILMPNLDRPKQPKGILVNIGQHRCADSSDNTTQIGSRLRGLAIDLWENRNGDSDTINDEDRYTHNRMV